MVIKSVRLLAVVLPLVLAVGCATVPTGPSIMALPGTGKNFEQFRSDDAQCRDYAQNQIGGTGADHAAVDSEVRSAAVGTLIGAVAGAAIGGHEGAGVGAGTGLLVGSMAGAGAGQSSAYGMQRAYDNAYIQCMYAKGEQVPVAITPVHHTHPIQTPVENAPSAPAPSYYVPPPPQGSPPSSSGEAPPAYFPPPPPPR